MMFKIITKKEEEEKKNKINISNSHSVYITKHPRREEKRSMCIISKQKYQYQ